MGQDWIQDDTAQKKLVYFLILFLQHNHQTEHLLCLSNWSLTATVTKRQRKCGWKRVEFDGAVTVTKTPPPRRKGEDVPTPDHASGSQPPKGAAYNEHRT